ncbi:pyridoxamine 5'-phosphate oxidase family protein [Aurantiacibacter gangjinensis]|uniref:General stress protein n=1 Tax=Aurantiacibacter gangjinensis TaxID=502682 RepID=A0A0G9MPY4_9SPHN|nr:pyridoxamine 5'-phosphate oxidase family protein [Aurantiacibacter gangjinensis]APE28605.1 Pyridoxamine 5'-phosphate oxidase [Aurantiacibacter gangjinensis]KLE32791.1 general stress protein [Aurantiacibacter gangjinensis]
MSTTDELKHKFWTALADSPFVFLSRDTNPEDAVPMTAQLDKDAESAIWFFTTKDHSLAQMGPATAMFAGKGHEMFARFTGTLHEETSEERFEKQWSRIVEAWYPGGKTDPNLLMLRMDLGQAEIWNSDLGIVDNTRMLLGFDVRDEARDEHTEAAL